MNIVLNAQIENTPDSENGIPSGIVATMQMVDLDLSADESVGMEPDAEVFGGEVFGRIGRQMPCITFLGCTIGATGELLGSLRLRRPDFFDCFDLCHRFPVVESGSVFGPLPVRVGPH